MKNKSYSDKLKDPRWQKKRLEVFNRDNFTCKMCGDNETSLCVHHLKYFGNPWEIENDFLVTMCAECHIVLEELIKEGFKIGDVDFTKIKNDTNTVIVYRCIDKVGIVAWSIEGNMIENIIMSGNTLNAVCDYKNKINGRMD